MITIRKHDYLELERILNSYIADPKKLQLGSGALPLLRKELWDYCFEINSNDDLMVRVDSILRPLNEEEEKRLYSNNNDLIDLMVRVDSILSPYFADDMFAKINNETFKTICNEIKEGIRLR